MNRMRLVFCLAVVCVAVRVVAQNEKPGRPQLTTSDIEKAEVIGRLGMPLGRCFEIAATVIRSDINTKASQGRFFLKVTRVEGRELDLPVVYDFYVHQFSTKQVKIAESDFALYELKNGKKAASLNAEQIAELEKGYVGTPVRLIVYETGGFRGRPNRIPGGGLPWADVGFGFATHLMVMDHL
jgi:hypothetical protein